MRGRAIVDRVRTICTSAVTQDVTLNKPTQGWVYEWRRIVGVNRTGATDTIEVGVKNVGEFYCFESAAAGAVNLAVATDSNTPAPGEFVPCARFNGATLGDVLELVVCGYENVDQS